MGEAVMDAQWLFIVIGAGCMWHGAQVIWGAPLPSQFVREKTQVEKGSAVAFQVFWLDQYAWIGISLVVAGVGMLLWGLTQ